MGSFTAIIFTSSPLQANDLYLRIHNLTLCYQQKRRHRAYFGLKKPPYNFDALGPSTSQKTLESHRGDYHRLEALNTHLSRSDVLYGYTMDELVKVTYNYGNPLPELNDAAQTKFDTALAAELLIENEEAVIAAAAAEALALARAALKLAKDAALMAVSSQPIKPESKPEGQSLFPDGAQRLESEQLGSVRNSEIAGTSLRESRPDDMEPTKEELQLLEAELAESITVRSTRQGERKARRARAADKAASNVVTLKLGSNSRKKRTSVQEVDYSDPLRYLRGTTTSSRLLTSAEELELSAGIQDLLKLERLHKELKERFGDEPSFVQWAAAAGIDQRTLRKRLNHGIMCKDKMIKSNVRLVISIAKNYQGSGMNLQDLVQEGCRGLVRGAEKFDASKGFKFSTYAHWWIKQAVRKSLSDQSRTIRLPFHMVEATYRVKEARKQLYSENGRQPDNEEVAEATGLSMKRLTAVLMTPKAPRSLDQKVGLNMNLKPSEVIADPEAESAEDLLTKQFMRQDLEKVLDTLSPREKQVIRWRFGLEDGRMKTLQEIGELMGVSRERIRQIESSAFKKLQNKKRNKNLQQYLFT
ncbi:RNA polymerase sigma factor sigB isoform X1 [Beta vulgaris subsp. vulgaris]|uniref:RNA polymerase sigma factor sigB isoform X1 n=1 Tax=Beta vulgaris subsp. vulgaris TaxID=3555 RepID=UPI0020368556|nr:RNA polymerase sigma factor sigB isoform X1 [Beta vulgaris subsp. vulgaris]